MRLERYYGNNERGQFSRRGSGRAMGRSSRKILAIKIIIIIFNESFCKIKIIIPVTDIPPQSIPFTHICNGSGAGSDQ